MFKRFFIIILVSFASACGSAQSENEAIITDSDVSISKEELVRAIELLPSNIKKATLDDETIRQDIIRQMLVNKKISEEAKKIDPVSNPELYWKKYFKIQKALNELILKDYQQYMKIPDLTALAKERYKVNKEEYAKIPEKRDSSHILFKCKPGACDRAKLKPKVEEIYNKLINGDNFEALVDQYSDDLNSKAKKGRVGTYYWGQSHIDFKYLEGLFSIKKVGEYSNIVESRFGFHIIRLDKITPKKYKPFEEVKAAIVESLTVKYKKLALQEYMKSFQVSPDAEFNDKAIKEIFADLRKKMSDSGKETPQLTDPMDQKANPKMAPLKH